MIKSGHAFAVSNFRPDHIKFDKTTIKSLSWFEKTDLPVDYFSLDFLSSSFSIPDKY